MVHSAFYLSKEVEIIEGSCFLKNYGRFSADAALRGAIKHSTILNDIQEEVESADDDKVHSFELTDILQIASNLRRLVKQLQKTTQQQTALKRQLEEDEPDGNGSKRKRIDETDQKSIQDLQKCQNIDDKITRNPEIFHHPVLLQNMLTMPIVAAVKRTASLNDLDCRQLMPNRFVKLLDVKEALTTLIYDPVENSQAKQNINASSHKGDMSSSSSQESVVVSDDGDSINTIGLNEMSADESEDMIAASGTQCLDSQKTVEQQTNDYTDNLTSQIESEPMIELSTSLIETDFPERCLESANDDINWITNGV